VKVDDASQPSAIAGSLKPNIILIIEDDIGYEIPTYTGGQSYTTTVIDSLAHAGMQFTHCYASAMCSPSRITLLTENMDFVTITIGAFWTQRKKQLQTCCMITDMPHAHQENGS
jgi:arylsulfatase A